MKEKLKKAPGIFKKPIKIKKWEKKYLKKIYLPEDKKFLESLAVEEDGFVRINVDGLKKKDRDRLKALGKAIKKNRKGVNFILILIIILLAGGILFFQFYYKNKLVKRLVETNLEKVFLAEVDTDGVNLEIFNGRFSLGYLAIANANAPMKNLVEFSAIEADIDTAELLQGRVYIEEIGFTGMKRNTDRETSGLLEQETDETEQPAEDPGTAVEAAGEAPGESTIEDVANRITALTGGIDPKQLLEEQKANLVSLPLIENSIENVGEYTEHWQGRVDDWEGKIDDWEDSVIYIRGVNSTSFSTMEGAQSTITRLQTIYDNADRDYKAIQSDYETAEKQYNEVIEMSAEITAAVETDYEYVESLVTMPAGDKVKWAASILEDQLAMPLTKYLSYLDRGLEWYNRFKGFAEKREEKKTERRRPGRSLPPPNGAPAAFTVVRAFAGGEEPDLVYGITLNNLVSEPEKLDGVTSLELELDMPMTGAASALITEEGLNLNVPAAPFELGSSLAVLDVSSFTGALALSSGIGWADNRFSGNVDMSVPDFTLQAADPDSIAFRILDSSLEAVKPLAAAGDFTWSESEGLDMSLDTDIDSRLGDAVKAVAAEGAEEGLEMLKEYLGEQLDGPLSEFNLLEGDLEDNIERIQNYESELDKYRRMADDKISEIKKSVEDNIKTQAENLIKENLPENIVPEDVPIEEAGNALKDLGSKLKF